MPLTADQSRKLRDVMLMGQFTDDDYEQMTWLKLGVRARDVIAWGPLASVAYNLVNWCDAQGMIEELTAAIADRRPANVVVRRAIAELRTELNYNPLPGDLAPEPRTPTTRTGWRYQVVAFDLDATLIRGPGFHYSWRRVWDYLGLLPDLHREYRLAYAEKRITYRTWCERVCEEFQKAGLTRQMFADILRPIHLTNRCEETMKSLKREGFTLALVSGGIDTFLDDMFPKHRDYFDELNVFINRLHFDTTGQLTGVTHTDYDFEGKTRAVEEVCERQGCTMAEAVFVGEGENDAHVIRNVGLSIAYPPTVWETDRGSKVAIEEDDLSLILPHIRKA